MPERVRAVSGREISSVRRCTNHSGSIVDTVSGGGERRPRPGDWGSPSEVGTFTFLFTDIEASTRRWSEHPEAMSAGLVRHDKILRQAVEGHGGAVFKHTGDGICAVFATPIAGLSAALAAQQSLQADSWEQLGDLPVRMGLHSGTADRREGDYFGPALNRAARLMATAHGGQIVVSLPTAELLRDSLPPDVGLLDLGEHRLRDLARAERVFQVTHPDLRLAFPPLRALDVHRHNLPVTLTGFIGRELELEELARLLGSSRLLNLTGVGGAGKTRLAIQAAAQSLETFADGVFLVELAPLTDPELVPSEVATALDVEVGVTGPGSGTVVDKLCDYLRPRQLLLVLDNCEHLIAAVAGFCQIVLGRCPHVAVLATSREALDVPGEVVWRVPSLSLPPVDSTAVADVSGDAVALFCARARTADGEFHLTEDNVGVVSRICRRLDGIPLALELAAARLRVLRPNQVAERLDDRFRLLIGGGRTTPLRHQTLRATMDWSYDLLSERERALFTRVSVFAGSFSLDAVEAVGADGELILAAQVLEVLGQLIDKSLVSMEVGGHEARYRLLETVRQYGREKLREAGGEAATNRRHRDFFLRRVDEEEESVFSDEWTSLRWLGADRDNIRVAMQWSMDVGDVDAGLRLSAALWGYWTLQGQLGEASAALEQYLARAGGSPNRLVLQVMKTLGLLYLQQGEVTRAAAHLERTIAAARSVGDERGESCAKGLLGVMALQRGEFDRAQRLLEESSNDLKATDPAVAGWFRFNLPWITMARGDLEQATKELEAVLEFGERSGNENLTVHAVTALAPLLALAGEPERAEDLAAQGVDAARRMGFRRVLVMALVRAAEVATLLERGDWAESLLGEALTHLRNLAGRAWVADAVEMTALALGFQGRHQPAARLLAACEALRSTSGETAEARATHVRAKQYKQQAVFVLGPEGFAEAWRGGSGMSRDEMVAEALAELRRPAC